MNDGPAHPPTTPNTRRNRHKRRGTGRASIYPSGLMQRYTVMLCRDDAGWFANLSGHIPTYAPIPPELVRWSKTYASRDAAWLALDMAHALAQQLTREKGPSARRLAHRFRRGRSHPEVPHPGQAFGGACRVERQLHPQRLQRQAQKAVPSRTARAARSRPGWAILGSYNPGRGCRLAASFLFFA
jgi:hypothetical protein